MNTAKFTHTGLMPFDQDTLAFLQNAYTFACQSLVKLGGDNYIIAGCEINENNINPGLIILNGELLNFEGGSITLAKVSIVETIENVEFRDGMLKPVYFYRKAVLANEGIINFLTLKRINNLLEVKEILNTLNTQIQSVSTNLSTTQSQLQALSNSLSNYYTKLQVDQYLKNIITILDKKANSSELEKFIKSNSTDSIVYIDGTLTSLQQISGKVDGIIKSVTTMHKRTTQGPYDHGWVFNQYIVFRTDDRINYTILNPEPEEVQFSIRIEILTQ